MSHRPDLASRLRLSPFSVQRRPADLTFAADERPPPASLLALGLQHAATALALIAYVLAAARMAELSQADTRSFVTATILAMAVATLLQAWGGRLGSGVLLVHIPNPLMPVFAAAIAARYGLGSMVAVGLVTVVVAIVVSRIMPRLRPLFPPPVVGVVICMGGLSLVAEAMRHSFGLDAQFAIDPVSLLISGSAFAVIVAFSVWGNRRLKLFGLLAGILVGVAIALAAGRLNGGAALAATPFLGLPSLPTPVFGIDPGLLAAIVLVVVLTQLDTLGSVIIMHKMEEADWRRADMKMVGRGIQANALGDLCGAVLGGFPTVSSSANIALCHATRSTSRYIGLVAALALALVAFLPQATLALTLIPTPVLGAVELYAAAFLMVSGMELIASRALDSRGIFMVGLSFALGLTVMLMPGIAAHAPPSLRFLVGSGFIIAGLVAILLNLLFRLGTAQSASQALDDEQGAGARRITDFVESQGAIWAARREVVQRAALAALEAAEAIRSADAGTEPRRILAIGGSFDEFNFDIELRHSGAPLLLASAQAPDWSHLLEADDVAIDSALSQVSNVLMRRLADRVTSGTRDGGAFLRLHFDH